MMWGSHTATKTAGKEERSETKEGESWLWEHTHMKVEWF